MPRKFNCLISNVDQKLVLKKRNPDSFVTGRVKLDLKFCCHMPIITLVISREQFFLSVFVCFETMLHHTQSSFVNCQIKTDLINRRSLILLFALQERHSSCTEAFLTMLKTI